MSEETSERDRRQAKTPVSTGAGIAIAGVWLACTAVTITILVGLMIDPLTEKEADEAGAGSAILLLVLIFAPLIIASGVTRTILGRDDD